MQNGDLDPYLVYSIRAFEALTFPIQCIDEEVNIEGKYGGMQRDFCGNDGGNQWKSPREGSIKGDMGQKPDAAVSAWGYHSLKYVGNIVKHSWTQQVTGALWCFIVLLCV